MGDARALREQAERTACSKGRPSPDPERAQRRSAALTIDRDNAVSTRRAAPERQFGEFALGRDDRPVENGKKVDRLEHRLVLEHAKKCSLRQVSLDLDPLAEQPSGTEPVPAR